jgi:hypothetical protein
MGTDVVIARISLLLYLMKSYRCFSPMRNDEYMGGFCLACLLACLLVYREVSSIIGIFGVWICAGC